MTRGRGGRRLSAAFFQAFLACCLGLFPAFAGEPAVPRFEDAECPFRIPSDGSVRYGRLIVPENRSRPRDGRTVSISVLILKSRSGNPRPDPVLYLEGGPGGPSVAYYKDWLSSPILDQRDLILFDQRGVGNSLPSLACPEIRSARLEALTPGKDPEAARRAMLESARACAARLRKDGVDLEAYNTEESARDLADLRRVLGIPQWNLYGISYGTRLALCLMRLDPRGVRSAVLDSVVDPEADEYASAPGNARAAFDRFFAAVEADPGARKAFPNLRSILEKTADELNRNPRLVRIRLPGGKFATVRISGDTLLDAVYSFLYDPDSIPYIPFLIQAAAAGDVSHLAMFTEELLYDDLSDGLYYALQGHDEAPFSKVPEKAPGVYDPLRLEREMALAFGSGRAGPEANSPVSSDIPVFILAGGFDPITPAEGTRRAARSLTRGTFLLFPGLGHAVSTSSGVERLVAGFLDDPAKSPERLSPETLAVRPFAVKLFVTAAPYRLVTRLLSDRDPDTAAAVLAFGGMFLAGTLSLWFTWKDRRREGASRWGVAGRMAGGLGAVFNGIFMVLLTLAIARVDRVEPAMLFFGLPQGMAFLPWLARTGILAGVLLILGLVPLFRDRALPKAARGFFLGLAGAEVLFALALARIGLI